MELFTKIMAVKLRSHSDKYLIAGDDGETIRQSRNGSTRKANWLVELVEERSNAVRLKTIDGRYLTASDKNLLLGMSGKKVIQSKPENFNDRLSLWEPIRDGFQVRLKSWCGKFLRANGGMQPWRNSVTHDEQHTGSTMKWTLWDVEAVEEVVESDSLAAYLSSIFSFSTVADEFIEADSDEYCGSECGSPVSTLASVRTPRLTLVKSLSPRLSPKKKNSNQFLRSGMEFFLNAKAVRLRSHHNKYLYAEDDEETVIQDRNGASKNAKWVIEFVLGSDSIIRLKSCYGKYLTASNQPFLLGMTGCKVLQTLPRRLDSSVEWEPIRGSGRVKLRTRYGNFLRANGGLPPWRNSVTHDIPHRTATQDWILWDVDIAEIQVKSSRTNDSFNKKKTTEPPPPQAAIPRSDSLDFESYSPASISIKSSNFSRQQSNESKGRSPPKSEGRTIYYHVADRNGKVDEDVEEACYFGFKGNGVEELSQRLKAESGLHDIMVCSRSPFNGKLYPLRLQLPPNNAVMHVVLLDSASKVAKDLAKGAAQW